MKKKISFTLIAFVLFAAHISAQLIYSTGFSSSTGTYSEITDGTVVWSGADSDERVLNNRFFASDSTATVKSEDITGIPIGFDFTFNGEVKTSFVISGHGFIWLGGTTLTVDPDESRYLPLTNRDDSWATGRTNVVGLSVANTALGSGSVYGVEDTEISYRLTGTSPERVLTVQFKNDSVIPARNGPGATISHQIRLYESSNEIEFVFGEWEWVQGESDDYKGPIFAGLKGDAEGNAHLRDGEFAASGKANINTLSSTSLSIISWSKTNAPVSGLTYKFTPAAACAAPADKPTDLQLTATTSSIEGSFTKSDADIYIVLEGKNISLAGTNDKPADKTVYAAGDSINGKFRVIYYGDANEFSVNDLDASSSYTLLVFGANTYCADGPLYKTGATGRLQGSIKTKPEKPAALTVTEVGLDYVKLSVTANAAGDPVIVAYNPDSLRQDNNRNVLLEGAFETPAYDAAAGASLGDKLGTVVYNGEAATEIVIDNLTPNSLVTFGAWSVNSDNDVSPEPANANTLTLGTVPYALDPSIYPPFESIFEVTNGWTSEGGNFRLANSRESGMGDFPLAPASSIRELDAVNSFTSSWILLADGNNRVSFAGTYTGDVSRFSVNNPILDTDWSPGDSIIILAQKYGQTAYDTIYTYSSDNYLATPFDVTLPIENLDGDTVKIKVEWKMETYSPYSSGRKLSFTGFSVTQPDGTCSTPLLLKAYATGIDTVALRWTSNAARFEFAYKLDAAESEWNAQIIDNDTVILRSLTGDTDYLAKVRAICAEGDTSNWTSDYRFKTKAIPACPVPTNLQVTAKTANTATLTWEADDANLSWDLHWRKAEATAWIDSLGLTQTTVLLEELESGTAYLWSVKAYCELNESAYATQSDFETETDAGIASTATGSLKVSATGKLISILNPGNAQIRSVRIYNLAGALLNEIAVNGSDNVLIPVNYSHKGLLVEVNGSGSTTAFKVVLK